MEQEGAKFPQSERRAQRRPDVEAARPTWLLRNTGWGEIGSERYGPEPAHEHGGQEREGEGAQIGRQPGVSARGHDRSRPEYGPHPTYLDGIGAGESIQACLDIKRENSSVGLPVTDTKGWMLGADIPKSDQPNW
jgi:hypothetical protein